MEPVTEITSLDLSSAGIGIGYAIHPRDDRKNGLVWQHYVMVPTGSDYDDEIDTFKEAAFALLADALDDIDRAEPIDPEQAEDTDDDEENDDE